MTYHIRPSTVADIPTLLTLADEARGIMRRNGNMGQWVNGYPSAEIFRQDIINGNSYMVCNADNIAVATFAFVPGPEPTYSIIDGGEWIDDTQEYYVIHRIASLPEHHGIIKTIMDYCFGITDNIRIDTHRDNRIMQHLMQKEGFTYCGIIYLDNGDERLAYQKMRKR